MKFLCLVFFFISFAGCSVISTQNVKWEYKREVIDPTDGKNVMTFLIEGGDINEMLLKYHKKLNEYGEEGWELITVTEAREHIFKRKL